MKRTQILSAVLAVLMLVTAFVSGASAEGGMTAGTYEGTAWGRNGAIKVSVTVSDSAIESIEVLEHIETPTISDFALERIPNEIVEYQSLAVDSVSGATLSSAGVKNAVADALKQAGADVSALRAVEVNYPDLATDDIDADVLVIGGGTAGLVAAWAAANAGSDVVIVEKEDILGGTLSYSGAGCITVDSELNDPEIDDSLERLMSFYRDLNDSNGSVHQPDYDFLVAILSQTGRTADLLVEAGMTGNFGDWGNRAGVSFGIGYDMAKNIIELCDASGVKTLTGTKGVSLLADDGEVTGAIVENRSGQFEIHAKKVIVATGGASWSPDLKEAQPELNTVDLYEKVAPGSTADGMHMLETLHAKMSEDLFVKCSQPQFAIVFGYDWSNTPSTQMTMMINANGQRIYREDADDKVLTSYMIKNESTGYWTIIDGSNSVGVDEAFFEKVVANSASDSPRVAVYADTLEALAEKIGVDSAALRETFDAYQAAAESGEDALGKDASKLIPYRTDSGFYAVYRRPGSWGTIGGAYVDKSMHVLDAEGNVIPNVFAVGETATGQLFSDFYVGGFSLGLYTTAGRIAGETAAAELQ